MFREEERMMETGATHESASLTTRITTVREWLDKQSGELAKALPKGMDAQRFARITLTQVLRNPKLALCSRESFVLAIMETAALGLEPDSVSGLAYLVPFRERGGGVVCQLIVGYRGMVQLAYRHPKVASVAAEVVYAGDAFDVQLGSAPRIYHKPSPDSYVTGDRGAVIGAYAVAGIRGGGRPFVWMEKA